MKRTNVLILCLLCLVLFVVGSITFLRKKLAAPRRLDVYNWPYYITKNVLAGFEKEYKCKVNYKEYPSNEALLTSLEGNTGDWDVVFPSDYMVEKMVSKGLLNVIQKDKLTNWENLNPAFLARPFDPENKYSVPYIWGGTGIGYNKNFIETPPEDYDILWDARYKDKIGILDDIRYAIGMPLIWKGHSINTTDKAQLAEAERLLFEQKKLVKAYNSENYIDLLKSQEVWLFYGYSGDIIQAIADNPQLGFVIPKSGGIIYLDNMCIPSSCNEPELAHKFIDYILRPEVAADIINSKSFAMPNLAAEKFVRKEIKDNPGVYPPAELLAKCQSVRDLGADIKLYEEIWRRLKSN